MSRIVTICCVVVTCGALGLTVMNFVQNPVAAEREALREELRSLPEIDKTGVGTSYEWPFAEWQAAIKGKPKVWDELIPPPPPPKIRQAVKQAPGWDVLLKGVKVLTREVGGKPKIIYPGSPPGGEYVPIGTKINGCVLESVERGQVTFSHHWPPTDETRTFVVQRVRE